MKLLARLSTLLEGGAEADPGLDNNGLLDGITGFFTKLFNEIVYFIPKVLYLLCACILQVIDLCQALFRKLVGLDIFYMEGSDVAKSGDIIFEIFKNTFLGEGTYKAMNTAFWSIALLGLILLFITTIAGLIRNEYSPDKEKLNSKSGVVKNAAKALISLILVPITCFFCLYVGNAVVFAVDSATQPSNSATIAIDPKITGLTQWKLNDKGDKTPAAFCVFGANIPTSYTPISGIIFRASCYNANRVRLDDQFYTDIILYDKSPDGTTTNFNAFNLAKNRKDSATLIDEAFELNAKITTPARLNGDLSYQPAGGNVGLFQENKTFDSMNRFNVGLVSYYYNLWHFDFIIAFAFAIFVGKLFLEITLGLMQRLIEIMALLFFLPIVLSFMPVDEGGGFRKWRAHFITRTLSSYVTIISLNIFFIIYPLLRSFKLFGSGPVFDCVNNILGSIFVLAGLLSVKTINEVFATMFTIDKISSNIMSQGANAMTGVTGLAKKGITTTMGLAKIPLAPAMGMMKHGFAAGKIGINNLKQQRAQQRAVKTKQQRTAEVEKTEANYNEQTFKALNPNLNGTALDAAIQNDAQEFSDWKNDSDKFVNDKIADILTQENNAKTGNSKLKGAAFTKHVAAEQKKFREHPELLSGKMKDLKNQENRYKAAQQEGELRGKNFDDEESAKEKIREEKKTRRKAGAGGMAKAGAEGVGTAVNTLKDIIGF